MVFLDDKAGDFAGGGKRDDAGHPALLIVRADRIEFAFPERDVVGGDGFPGDQDLGMGDRGDRSMDTLTVEAYLAKAAFRGGVGERRVLQRLKDRKARGRREGQEGFEKLAADFRVVRVGVGDGGDLAIATVDLLER